MQLVKSVFRVLLALIFHGLLTQPLQAQAQRESAPLRPVQVSLVYPLSTSGFNAGKFDHAFSLNMTVGYHGGLKGLEVGGVANIIKRDVEGFQVAGFANIVGQDVKGFQTAGFANVNRGEVLGTQFAGFANISAKRVRATQAAGFLNLSAGQSQGTQVAGFANVAAGSFKGIQIAGFLNYTRKLKGIQVGVFNYADTLEGGAQIGVFSYVRHGGIKQLDLGVNELGITTLALRTGSPVFYNIYGAGIKPAEQDDFYWTVTLGLGTQLALNNWLALNLEATAQHLNEGAQWENRLQELYRAQAQVEVKLGQRLAVYGGPAWNTLVTENINKDSFFGQSWAESAVFDRTVNGRTRVLMRPGFQGGIRVNLDRMVDPAVAR